MPWTRGWSYTDHVTAHALITSLIMNWSRDLACSDLVSEWCWSCTDHVADHTEIQWLIMHWSRRWSCTDHVIDQELISDVISVRKYDYSLAAYKNNKTKTAVILIIKESFSLSQRSLEIGSPDTQYRFLNSQITLLLWGLHPYILIPFFYGACLSSTLD